MAAMHIPSTHQAGTSSSVQTSRSRSRIGSHPDDESPDPDGLNQAKRMQIEATAIDKISNALARAI